MARDQIVAHSLVAQRVRLEPRTRRCLDDLIASHNRDFVFLCLRYIAKRRRVPPELAQMASGKMWYPLRFALTAAQIAISVPFGWYRPR
jgi:hypothetical protein